jgi:hypothetical protein
VANQNPPAITPEQSLSPSGITPESTVASAQLDLQSEVNRLMQEVKRLNEVIADQSAELDSLRQVAQAWAVAQLTEADIRRYEQDEPGLPLEAFIDELEQPL